MFLPEKRRRKIRHTPLGFPMMYDSTISLLIWSTSDVGRPVFFKTILLFVCCLLLQDVLRGLSSSRVIIGGLSSNLLPNTIQQK